MNGNKIVDPSNEINRGQKRNRELDDVEAVKNGSKINHLSEDINEDVNYQNDPEVRIMLKQHPNTRHNLLKA